MERPIPVITRLRQSLQARWYKFVSTDRLINQVRSGRSGPGSQTMLDALRERLAYQDGYLGDGRLVDG